MTGPGLAVGRREVLAFGAVLALPAFPALASSAVPAGYVLDTRFPAALAASPPASGWTQRIDGDVTPLWVDRLDLWWRDPRSGAVAGLTGEDALFVLEHLAWDRQRRVVLRQAVAGGGGPVPLVRWLIAPRRA